MYTVAVVTDFVAQHVLMDGGSGPENEWHSHHYRLEVRLEGESLGAHGYLVNIEEIDASLERLVSRYRDRTLNDLPELVGLNPSVEHVARAACEDLARDLDAPNVRAITVKLWEKPTAWAAYRLELSSDEPSKGAQS